MQHWAACHIDNRLYRFEALPCDCVAVGLDIGSNMDSLSNYFCRLPDSNSHFLAREKIRAPRAPVFRRNSDCWRFFFSVQQNRTGAISGIGLILPPPPKQNTPNDLLLFVCLNLRRGEDLEAAALIYCGLEKLVISPPP